MALGKPAKPVHQPFGGKIRRCADRQNTGALTLHQAFGAERDPIQCVAHHRKIFATGLGHDQPLALASEQLDAERRLQRLDLMTHRPMGDAQLRGGTREAFAACRSLEGLDSVERWQPARHRGAFVRKTHEGIEKICRARKIAPGAPTPKANGRLLAEFMPRMRRGPQFVRFSNAYARNDAFAEGFDGTIMGRASDHEAQSGS
jgi:hypothetical protein